MNPEEYDNLAKVEKLHWYYAGKRDIVRYWISKLGELQPTSVLADCGAGTGAFALEMNDLCMVRAIDDYPESLAILNDRLGPDLVLEGSCTALPLDTNSCDYATALDVLEHIEDDIAAMRELHRIVRPGGTVIVTVPALMSLWSDWDVSLRHFRRYDRKSLESLISCFPFEVVQLNYMNFWAFPVVWILRKLRKGEARNDQRAEDTIPPTPINEVLKAVFVWASCQTVFQWPFGVGLLAVLKKK